MLRIHEQLQHGAGTSSRKLAAALEVSVKTIARDLAFMRDQLDLPVQFDASTQSWRYAYSVRSFPTVQITEGEMLALLVARKALEQYRGTPYHAQLERAFKKLSGGLTDRISFAPTTPEANISFHRKGLSTSDLSLFEPLARAVNESREISFVYKKPGATKSESRRVRPYHLAHREDAWYLVAFDLEKAELRNFAVARMGELEVLASTFTRPRDFSPERHFAKAFGVFIGEGDHQVTIRFNASVAERVKERVWHDSQRTSCLPDGSLEVTFSVGGLEEVFRWLLGWANDAEVVQPPELRALVAKRAAETVRQYSI